MPCSGLSALHAVNPNLKKKGSSSSLKGETEGFILAAHYQSLATWIYQAKILKGGLSGLTEHLTAAKWWKMLFISHQKLFSFSRYLSFYLEFLVM